MELKIAHKKENKLLTRFELTGDVGFTGATPSYDALRKELATHLKVAENLLAIQNISTKFGSTKATFVVHQYSTPESLLAIEPKVKAKKVPGAAAEKK